MFFFAPNHDWKSWKLVDHVPFCLYFVPVPLFKVGSGGPLPEKVRQYPAFKDKKMT